MLMTLSDLITEYQDQTKDDSATNKARAIRRINQHQSRIMAFNEYPFAEEEFNISTVSQQYIYRLPQRIRKITSVRFDNLYTDHVPIEIVDPKKWDQIISQTSQQYSDYIDYFHIRENTIQFWPIPSTASITFTVLAQQRALELITEDYSDGTISITNGSATITGTSTQWNTSNNVRVGDTLVINEGGYNYQYLIAEIVSDTEITLEETIDITTGSGLSYRIGAVSLIPVDFHDLLWLGPTMDYYGHKESDTTNQFKVDYETLLSRMYESTRTKSTSNIIKPTKKFLSRNINYYPRSIG